MSVPVPLPIVNPSALGWYTAEASVAESVGSSVANVNGRGPGTSAGTSSSGCPASSRYSFSRQLLSAAPAVVKMARRLSVSTTTSRDVGSIGAGASTGAATAGAAAGPVIAGAVVVPGTPVAAGAGPVSDRGAGLGAKYDWYSARTTNERKIAKKTRFSMNG